MEIFFESNKETFTFCESLFQHDLNMEINWKIHEEWGNQIKFENVLTERQKERIAEAMVNVFVQHREINWVNYVIKSYYYYQNSDEIQRITELTQAIMEEEDRDLSEISKELKPRDKLLPLFLENVNEKDAIHYDSVVKFRFQSYRNVLVELVGLAIDEFKREEDYQSFVHSLREYVAKKETKFHEVHVLQGTDFVFYKANGTPFTKMEVKMLMQKEPLYIVGLDTEEMNITPLLAMAPKKIKIYGNYLTEPKTLTVINIFQERAEFEPVKNFPFKNYLKS